MEFSESTFLPACFDLICYHSFYAARLWWGISVVEGIVEAVEDLFDVVVVLQEVCRDQAKLRLHAQH